MIVVLIGAPGSGKGTQAKPLADRLGLAHIASGDLFRQHLKDGTELGLLAQSYMNQGLLVPDDVTIRMMLERMSEPDCASGVILDGFPRTLAQAKALDEALAKQDQKVDRVPYIRVSNEELLRRMSGRWICRTCGASYHAISNPPKVAGVCNLDRGELYQREDDTEEVARKRLKVYFDETLPVLRYYAERNVLFEIDGEQSIDRVFQALSAAIRDGHV